MAFYIVFLLVLALFSNANNAVIDKPDYANYEYKLRQHLYGNRRAIDVQHRPSLHSNQTTHVELGLSIIGIVDLDASKNTLTSNVWVRLIWYDYTFHWNEEDFGGIGVLRIPEKYIWKPDVQLQNSAEMAQSELAEYKSNTLIYPNGQVLWVPSSTYDTSCAVDLEKFPFDIHVCTFEFRSWSSDGKKLKLEGYDSHFASKIDLSDFWENNEWIVGDATDKVSQKTSEDSSNIIIAISLQRRSFIYILTFIIPTLLSWMLMLILFCFPVGSNQRIFLSSLTVVYIEILLMQLRWVIPSNGSKVPRIIVISGQSIVFAAFSLVLSVALIAMVKMSDPPRLPDKLKSALIGWLGCILQLGHNRIGVSLGARLLNSSNVELNVDKCGQNEIYNDWTLLIRALNRLFFITYLCSFFLILVLTLFVS